MTKSIRAALFACAVISTLAFAGSALASYAPKLVVSAATGATRIGVIVSNTDDPTAAVNIFIPQGYQLGSPAAGTKLGDVTATAAAADLGGAVLPLTGELQAITQGSLTPAGQVAAGACAQGQTPSQYWNLHLTAAGQTLDIPMFVYPGSAAVLATGYQTRLCVFLPPPDVPAGTPGRATFGAKLLSATFASSAVTQPPAAGDYRWTSLFTPYNPGKGTPNTTGTVEAQALQHLPALAKLAVTKKKLISYKSKTVTIKGKKKTVRVKVIRTQVKFSSTVTENGAAPTNANISTTVNGKRIGGASGAFILAAGKSATIVATAVADSDSSVPTGQAATPNDLFYHDLGGGACVKTPLGQGVPCISATLGGETIKVTTKVKGYTK